MDGELAAGAARPARIERLGEHVGQRVRLEGWLHNRRSKGKLHFLIVRDGSGFVQCVALQANFPPETFDRLGRLRQETALVVTGTVRQDARAPGGYELQLEGCEVVHEPLEDFPLGHKDHGPDFLLQHRHLWLRSSQQWAVLRVRHEVEQAIADFFYERGFVRLDAPILTPAACEGTTTLFELDYFDQGKAYLTQSGQLYAEAGALAFGRVYTFGPTFRAEKSKTRRHLTEFWMVEPELAYATLDDVMALAEEFVVWIVRRVLARCRRELELLGRDLGRLEAVVPPFPRLRYDEAVELLRARGREFAWGGDFGAPDETVLSEAFDRPVMIHRYPKDVKAFYMKRDPEDPRLVLCVDVIAPEGVGEIIGGSQREDDLEALRARIAEHGLDEQVFRWYLDLRRWGSVPHGGFGLGLERTVAWLCGREHVRECIPFPRMLYRIYP
ncbi:MAG: asparagine--tRNA ligase [Planctomycetota bacterium]|nr:MAG: asparagine--tRNA ligase [Planctomycetota bacterium]